MRDAKQRLRPLDRIDPPDVWHRATQLDPVGEVPPAPQPSLQSRVTAGVVAFAVFAGAVALALGAFDRSATPAPPASDAPPISGPMRITLRANGNEPSAVLEFEGRAVEGIGSSFCWQQTDQASMCADVVDESFGPNDLVVVPPGQSFEVDGDAGSSTARVRPGFEDQTGPERSELTDTLPSEPGRYILSVSGRWPQGTREFAFLIEVEGPTPSPSEPAPGGIDPIVVTAPSRDDEVVSPVTVAGTADVFEATVSVEIYDATNNLIAESFATATCGSGCRGDFSVEVPYEVGEAQPGTIKVFEVSAENGRPINVVRVPVTLTAGADDPIAEAVEGVWSDADGAPLPDGTDPSTDFALTMHVHEGPDHCGWTSVSFMSLAWPLGATTEPPGSFRQYLRDPLGVLSEFHASAFGSEGRFPDDAEPTGYHRGSWELWVAPSDVDDAVYVVEGDPQNGGTWERWPRTTDIIGCR